MQNTVTPKFNIKEAKKEVKELIETFNQSA